MKAIKRTVAALLATLMLATSTSFTLAAENYTDEEAVIVAKAGAAGIMTGTDKGFEPSKSLTRAEAAAIIVRMKGISESAVKATAGTTLFKDVAAAHWASGYVNQASNLGIVKGVSATEFAPDREVTIAEFTTMAVRALGAGQLVDSEGVWPTNYVNFANEEGLLDDVNAIYTATATRLQAATIVVNSLTDAMWEKTGVKSNGEIEWSNKNGKTILKNVLKLTVKDENNAEDCRYVSIKDKEFNNYDVAKNVDLTKVRVGLTYDFWLNDDNEIVGLWVSEGSELNTVNFTEIDKVTTSKVTLKVDGSEKEYKIDKNTKFYLNELDKTSTLVSGYKNKAAIGVAYIDDNTVSKIYAEQFEKYGVVDEVKTAKVVFDDDSDIKVGAGYAASDITINDDDNEYFLTRNGEGISFSDLKEGEVVAYYEVSIVGGKKYIAEVVNEKVSGKVTSIVDDDTIKVDGEKYDVLASMPRIGDEIEAYLTKAGKIVLYTKVDEAASDVAVIKYIREKNGTYDKDYEIKLAYTDGTVSDRLVLDLVGTFDNYAEDMPEWLKSVSLYTVTATGGESLSVDGKAAATIAKGTVLYKVSTSYYTKDGVSDLLDAFDTDAKETEIRDTLAALDSTNHYLELLGDVVCYEVSGSKVALVPAQAGADAEYVDKEGSSTRKLVVTNRTTYIKDGSTIEYYLTDSTKVFNVKTDDTYEVKVEAIDVESLDNTDIDNALTVADIDTDSKEVGFVFLSDESIKRSTEANFAFVTEVTRIKYEGNNANEVTVVYMNGEKATYTFYGDEANTGFTCPEKGDLLDITLNGEFIIDGDKLPQGTSPAKTEDYIIPHENVNSFVDEDNSKRNEFVLKNASTLVYADDVLVLLHDDNKYSVVDLSEIDEFDDAKSSNMRIKDYYEYKEDEDEVEEAVVIVIEEVEARDVADAIIAGIAANDANYALYDFEVNGNKITITQKTAADETSNIVLQYTATSTDTITFTLVVEGDDTVGKEVKAVATYTITYNE